MSECVPENFYIPFLHPHHVGMSLDAPIRAKSQCKGHDGVELLDAHLADRGFCSDMNQLFRAGITYDPQQAGQYVKTKLLNLLP
jgi:hypothetical protein